MRKNKILILSLSLALIMGLFSGCSGSAKKVSSENETEVPTIAGQVTAIDGKNITLSLFSGRGMQNGGGRPGGSKQRGSREEGGEPNFIPNTTDKEIPDVKPEVPSADTATKDANTTETEEKVITISDDTQVNIEDGDSTKTGTIDDITVGCNLSVTYTKDETGNDVISSVTVRNFSGGPRGQGPSGKGQSTDETASEDDSN